MASKDKDKKRIGKGNKAKDDRLKPARKPRSMKEAAESSSYKREPAPKTREPTPEEIRKRGWNEDQWRIFNESHQSYQLPRAVPEQGELPRSKDFTRPESQRGSADPKDLPIGVRKKGDSKKGTSQSGASGSFHREELASAIAAETRADREGGGRASQSEITRRAKNTLNARRAREARESYDYLEESVKPPARAKIADIHDVERADRAANWRTEPDLFTNAAATKAVGDQNFLTTKEHFSTLPKAMQDQIHKDATTKGSPITQGLDLTKDTHGRKYAPNVGRRLDTISRSLQLGSSLPEAYARAAEDNRGRGSRSRPTGLKRVSGQESRYNRPQGRKTKYVSTSQDRGAGFHFGMTGSTIDKMSDLRKKFPDTTPDKELIRMQQYQRMNVADEIMKNQRWAHETQRSRILSNTPGKEKESGSNRVVFFTTSIGHPAASVPADSLVGQYVIRQRKKFLVKEKVYKSNQLRGSFPDAVRDMHVVELGTGVSFGTQGVIGAFQKSGWRVGNRKSRGYGRPVPVGSQIMYDSQGRPVYDTNGNIRFSDGATRTYDIGTDKDLGLRIFVG